MRSADRISVWVPSAFVVPAPPPAKELLAPVPGTATAENLGIVKQEAIDKPFLVPWKQQLGEARVPEGKSSGTTLFTCTIDAKALAQANEKFDTAASLAAVFKSDEQRDDMVKAVLASMENPFASNRSPIVWHLDRRVYLNPLRDDTKLGGKSKAIRHRTLLHGTPWTVRSFGEPGRGVIKNLVYGEDGRAIAQVDLCHPQFNLGTHVHALVKDNLDHTPSEDPDHLFKLRHMPWAWCCVPVLSRETCAELIAKKKGCDSDGGDSDDDDVDNLMALGQPLPDTREFDRVQGWVQVSLPYENFSSNSGSM